MGYRAGYLCLYAHPYRADRLRQSHVGHGPLAIARDLMVINVTKKDIVVRMAVVVEYVLPPAVTQPYRDAKRTDKKETSKFIMEGRWKGYTPPPRPKK